MRKNYFLKISLTGLAAVAAMFFIIDGKKPLGSKSTDKSFVANPAQLVQLLRHMVGFSRAGSVEDKQFDGNDGGVKACGAKMQKVATNAGGFGSQFADWRAWRLQEAIADLTDTFPRQIEMSLCYLNKALGDVKLGDTVDKTMKFSFGGGGQFSQTITMYVHIIKDAVPTGELLTKYPNGIKNQSLDGALRSRC